MEAQADASRVIQNELEHIQIIADCSQSSPRAEKKKRNKKKKKKKKKVDHDSKVIAVSQEKILLNEAQEKALDLSWGSSFWIELFRMVTDGGWEGCERQANLLRKHYMYHHIAQEWVASWDAGLFRR